MKPYGIIGQADEVEWRGDMLSGASVKTVHVFMAILIAPFHAYKKFFSRHNEIS